MEVNKAIGCFFAARDAKASGFCDSATCWHCLQVEEVSDFEIRLPKTGHGLHFRSLTCRLSWRMEICPTFRTDVEGRGGGGVDEEA